MSKSNMRTKTATVKLSDMQRSLMIAAAQREDRCLIRPQTLRGAQAVKLSEALIDAGYVRELNARDTLPVWRQDGKSGAAFTLKLTAAGAKAIAPERAPAVSTVVAAEGNANGLAEEATLPKSAAGNRADAQQNSSQALLKAVPRANSKIAAVIALLSRSEGVTLTELVAATDWLPHTTRAALTGLRKRGYTLTLDRGDRQRGSVYRITAQPSYDRRKTAERASEAA